MQKLIPILIIAASLIPGAGQAQTETGTDILLGQVTDMNGRPIGDAQVGVTSLQSGLRRSVTTDGEGRYKIYFPETPPRYLVLVKKLGFAPAQQTIIRHTTKPEEMTVDMKLGGTPLALSMNFLSRLNDRDLRMLSTDRNIPDVLRITARKKIVIDK